jgi:cysteine synthase
MAFYLLESEGLFVGPSAALNVVGAVKAGELYWDERERERLCFRLLLPHFHSPTCQMTSIITCLLTDGMKYLLPSPYSSPSNTPQPARALGPGHTIVTILCDGGERYLAKAS